MNNELSHEVNEQYIMAKLKEIIDDDSISTKDKLAALRMAGIQLGMFVKQVNVDVRKLVAQLSMDQLEGIRGNVNQRQLEAAPETVTVEAKSVDDNNSHTDKPRKQRVQPRSRQVSVRGPRKADQ
jgi:hypothetical protein